MTTPVYHQDISYQTTTLVNGEKNVAVAGTDEALSASSIFTHELIIQAKRSNTQPVFVGGENVPNNNTGGYSLLPGENFQISAINLQNVFINAQVNGEGVMILYRKPNGGLS